MTFLENVSQSLSHVSIFDWLTGIIIIIFLLSNPQHDDQQYYSHNQLNCEHQIE